MCKCGMQEDTGWGMAEMLNNVRRACQSENKTQICSHLYERERECAHRYVDVIIEAKLAMPLGDGVDNSVLYDKIIQCAIELVLYCENQVKQKKNECANIGVYVNRREGGGGKLDLYASNLDKLITLDFIPLLKYSRKWEVEVAVKLMKSLGFCQGSRTSQMQSLYCIQLQQADMYKSCSVKSYST